MNAVLPDMNINTFLLLIKAKKKYLESAKYTGSALVRTDNVLKENTLVLKIVFCFGFFYFNVWD